MAGLSEADLARARLAVNALLDDMGVTAHLHAVEPRGELWVVIVECATESGWQRAELQAGPELLNVIRGDADAETTLISQWLPHLAACKKD